MNQLPDDILKTLNDHERRLNDMERAPRATSIITSNVAVVWLGQLERGYPMICQFILSEGEWENPINVSGWPRWTIAKNVTDFTAIPWSNIYPMGVNWTLQNIEDLEVVPYMAKDVQGVPDNRQTFYLILKNKSSTPIPQVGVALDWKLPQISGATS